MRNGSIDRNRKQQIVDELDRMSGELWKTHSINRVDEIYVNQYQQIMEGRNEQQNITQQGIRVMMVDYILRMKQQINSESDTMGMIIKEIGRLREMKRESIIRMQQKMGDSKYTYMIINVIGMMGILVLIVKMIKQTEKQKQSRSLID